MAESTTLLRWSPLNWGPWVQIPPTPRCEVSGHRSLDVPRRFAVARRRKVSETAQYNALFRSLCAVSSRASTNLALFTLAQHSCKNVFTANV